MGKEYGPLRVRTGCRGRQKGAGEASGPELCFQLQLILISHWPQTCTFTCLLKIYFQLQSQHLQSLRSHWWTSTQLRKALVGSSVPARVKQGDSLPSGVNSHKCPFCSQCRATVFTFGGFSWVISLFKMACKPSAEVLSGVPKCKKAGCALCVK